MLRYNSNPWDNVRVLFFRRLICDTMREGLRVWKSQFCALQVHYDLCVRLDSISQSRLRVTGRPKSNEHKSANQCLR